MGLQFITHDGDFSISDVFASAIVCAAYKDSPDKIIRVNNQFLRESKDILCWGIEGSRYWDDSTCERTTSSSKCTMLESMWNDLGYLICDDPYDINDMIIQPVRHGIQYVKGDHQYSNIIDILNNRRRTDVSQDFISATTDALMIINHRVEYINNLVHMQIEADVLFSPVDNGVLVLDEYEPIKKFAKNYKNVKFMIYPSDKGGYIIDTILENVSKPKRNIYVDYSECAYISEDGNIARLVRLGQAIKIAVQSVQFNKRIRVN